MEPIPSDRYNARPRPAPGVCFVDGRTFHVLSYAVIALGGKQYRVEEGERLLVDRLHVDEGAQFEPRVLVTGGDGTLADGGRVSATVEEHVLGPKVRVFYYRAKKDWSKRRGHRSRLSRVRIDSIVDSSGG